MNIVKATSDRFKSRWVAEGIITESMDKRVANNSQLQVSQTMNGELVELVAGDVIANLSVFVATNGSSLTLVKVGIYNSANSLVASSADNKANFGSSGVTVTTALSSSYTVPSTGGYYLAILSVGTTPPTLQASNNTAAFLGTAIGTGLRPCATMAGQADLPGTATWAASAQKPIWIAAS